MQPRRHRRLYTNDGRLIFTRSNININQTQSDEHIASPHYPIIEPIVHGILSTTSYEHIVDGTEYLLSNSRDLSSRRRRPITSVVAGQYHKVMPSKDGATPPRGYVPVYTNQGRVLWRRLTIASNRHRWVMRVPMRQWNVIDRQDIDFPEMIQVFLLPIQNANNRISNESLDVNVDQVETDLW